MSVRVLLEHQRRRHGFVLLPMAAAAGLLHFLLTRMAPVSGDSWLTRVFEQIPPELLAMAGNEAAGMLTPQGFLATGYGHPFFLLLLAAWTVRVSCAALAGEVGNGTMDLLAARHVRRWEFVAAGWLACLAGVLVIVLAAWSGTALGSSLRGLGLGRTFIPVAIAAGLLFTAWSAVGLLVSATRRDGGAAIGVMSAIVAVAFVLEYLARLWQPIRFLRPLSLFRYYEPPLIVATGPGTRNLLILSGVAVTCVLAAVLVFRRRDL